VSANAADADGTVTQVEFFANGSPIGTDTTAPYGIEWANVAAGSYSLTARATDNLGAQTTSAAVPITVNAPPTVSLSSPAQNATFTAPANITLTVDAADADGTVTSVEFYQGTTLITTLGTAPYTFAWTNVPQGAYVLTAKATDDRGAVTTSAPVNITVGAAVGQLYFIHADHLNTPRLVADSTGTTVWRWDQQEPFGVNPADEDPDANSVAFDLPLRLPGQRYDKETNLHYNYFRDYDPSIGRYGESDPIGLNGGLNTYVYGLSAPIMNKDPRGLDVYLCTRPIDVAWIPDWAAAAILPPHTWIKTDTYESGMGGECPTPGQQCSDRPYVATATKSHAGQSTQPNSTCMKLQNVSEECVDNLIKPGSPTGTWTPYNQCQAYAWGVTAKCRYGPQIGPVLPNTLQSRGPLGTTYGP
jgi:RHS repeat-associated protein